MSVLSNDYKVDWSIIQNQIISKDGATIHNMRMLVNGVELFIKNDYSPTIELERSHLDKIKKLFSCDTIILNCGDQSLSISGKMGYRYKEFFKPFHIKCNICNLNMKDMSINEVDGLNIHCDVLNIITPHHGPHMIKPIIFTNTHIWADLLKINGDREPRFIGQNYHKIQCVEYKIKANNPKYVIDGDFDLCEKIGIPKNEELKYIYICSPIIQCKECINHLFFKKKNLTCKIDFNKDVFEWFTRNQLLLSDDIDKALKEIFMGHSLKWFSGDRKSSENIMYDMGYTKWTDIGDYSYCIDVGNIPNDLRELLR